MFSFAIRNLKIFFRQKSAVFFSLLSVFIIIGLYALFLGDIWLMDLADIPGAKPLMNSWIMAGIISVTSLTTTLGAFSIMVEDRVDKIDKDFFTSPLKRVTIVGGYILSSYAIGVIMSVFAFVLGEVFIVINGGAILNFYSIISMLVLILLSTAMSSALVFFLVSFFKSNAAFATASTVVGTLIGFLTGVYIPIGSLPTTVGWVIKLFPVSHSASLMRQVMMKDAIAISFANVPTEYILSFKETMGVIYNYGDYTMPALGSISIIIAAGIVFFILALINVSRKPR